MRAVIRYSLCAAIGAIALVSSSLAQTITFEEYLKEKTRWSREEIEQALKDRVVQGGFLDKSAPERGMLSGSNREMLVSNDVNVESEVHAAINPADSNNIIVSPIQQGAVNNGLLCPVYYTKDFGVTWRRSNFQSIARVDGQIFTFAGGDPIVTFDNNGTAYLFWLSVHYKDFNTNTIYSGIFWAYSTDGGVTWTQAEDNYVALSALSQSSQSGSFYDKEWVAVDGTNTQNRN
ncbi:MAG TPA: sialidase family protein, partial [Anseongella sp.]|nr:sialidase family protein [Anseongella sp.]